MGGLVVLLWELRYVDAAQKALMLMAIVVCFGSFRRSKLMVHSLRGPSARYADSHFGVTLAAPNGLLGVLARVLLKRRHADGPHQQPSNNNSAAS